MFGPSTVIVDGDVFELPAHPSTGQLFYAGSTIFVYLGAQGGWIDATTGWNNRASQPPPKQPSQQAKKPMSNDEPAILLLIKMMKMTTAEDNIALVAIRKANEVLKRESWDWEALLRGKVTIIGDPFASVSKPPPHANRPPPPQPAPRPAPPPPQPQPRPHYSYASAQPRQAPPRRQQSVYTCSDCGTATVYASGATCYACLNKRQTYAAKAAQTAKQRRKNPMTLDDIL